MTLAKSSLIYLFCAIKFLMHAITNTTYGLHRDEFLYWSDGQHLDWGFVEVPPFTPFLACLSEALGGSPFMLRLFPTLAGVLTVWLVGKMVVKLGGKHWAIILACSAIILSPAFCRSNTLFQPVSFNQLFWFLSAYQIIRYIQFPRKSTAIWLGVILGLGILNKYSILFYAVALLSGVLMTPQRKILWNKNLIIIVLIPALVTLPNLLWQLHHNLPVLQHMRELHETQLVLISSLDFIVPLFLFFLPAVMVWILGMVSVFKINEFKPYRFVVWSFLFVILIVWALRGKAYYIIGAFTILFPFGAIYVEQHFSKVFRGILFGFMILTFTILGPYSLSILSLRHLEKYCDFMARNFHLTAPIQWENGRIYSIPQDIADMHGWEEIPQKIAHIYHNLPADKQQKCMIYASSYGHAGSILYYQNKYQLPAPVSLNAGFLKWSPADIDFEDQIYVDDRKMESSEYYESIELLDSIEHPYARDPGYIYYRSNPKVNVTETWKSIVTNEKARFNFD